VFACEGGQAILPGLNENWQAGGKARKFYADFPKDVSKPMAVVFWYHGYGDTAANFRKFAPSPDTDPTFPFVLITPEDTDLQPFSNPQGLDWDLFSGKAADPNFEGALFEAINGCLGAQLPIDSSRLYVAGFSAGAILSNMLFSRYQGKIAASLAFSGAWFNDPEQVKGINTLGFQVNFSWEPLSSAGQNGMVLLTHGGPQDTFGAAGQQVIDFEECAQEAIPFLKAAGRSFIDCAHNEGHIPHPDVTKELAIRYFKDHRVGEPSPYTGGKLPADFPASCSLQEP
jgi:poly(3-hydroxybutyrate) depolymerase